LEAIDVGVYKGLCFCMADENTNENSLGLASDIVAAYVSNNALSPAQLPDLIRSVVGALNNLGGEPPPVVEPERRKPAVPITRSVQNDYIVCLEDGKRLKMLKRYLRARYDMSPDDYRRKWGLAADYPMVAPAYAERRSQFAREIGLGKGVRRK
jgi:predicted transcriptional regulator